MIDRVEPDGEAVVVEYSVGPEYLRYIALKGPVCVDGVSLTVIAKTSRSFSVSLVQHTQRHTNLMLRKVGDRANLETDLVARYVEQLLVGR